MACARECGVVGCSVGVGNSDSGERGVGICKGILDLPEPMLHEVVFTRTVHYEVQGSFAPSLCLSGTVAYGRGVGKTRMTILDPIHKRIEEWSRDLQCRVGGDRLSMGAHLRRVPMSHFPVGTPSAAIIVSLGWVRLFFARACR